jgi:hypothetical protein
VKEIPMNFAAFFAWIILFAVLNIIMYRTALEKTSVQGAHGVPVFFFCGDIR